jgi:hypothetical protein
MVLTSSSTSNLMARYTLMHSGKKLSAMAATTSAELAGVISDKVGTGPLSFGGREVLTADRTYYVATTGNDSNTGLTAGAPFLTIQKAVDVVMSKIDHGVYNVVIQVADGTYTAATTTVLLNTHLGNGSCTLQGNNSTPANCVISSTGGRCVQCGGGIWNVRGFKFTTSGSGTACVYVTGRAAWVQIFEADFGACVSNHIEANAGRAGLNSNYTISGSAGGHINMYGGSMIGTAVITGTVTGAPAFSNFVSCTMTTNATFNLMTYSGSATGTRYNVASNSVILCGGSSTFFPGNASGATATGGQYL